MKYLGLIYFSRLFIKANKVNGMNRYIPYECFNAPNKLDEIQLRLNENFYSTLKISNLLDKEDDVFQKFLNFRTTKEQLMKKLRLKPKLCD